MRFASRTAEFVAWARVGESHRSGACLHDPQSRAFLHAPVRLFSRIQPLIARLDAGITNYIVARHAVIDQRLGACLKDPAVEGVVLLGAGYDTRAWRLASLLRERPWVEVDIPATARRKRRKMTALGTPPPGWRQVQTDFASQPLAALLDQEGIRGRWLVVWEGVSMYLPRSAVQATLAAVGGQLTAGGRLWLDAFTQGDQAGLAGVARRVGPVGLDLLGEPVRYQAHPDDLAALLAANGLETLHCWRHRELSDTLGGRRCYPGLYLIEAGV